MVICEIHHQMLPGVWGLNSILGAKTKADPPQSLLWGHNSYQPHSGRRSSSLRGKGQGSTPEDCCLGPLDVDKDTPGLLQKKENPVQPYVPLLS